jgi:hypothetical protein
MNIRECFQRLEIPPSANAAEIKQAYIKLVKNWHPDKFENNHLLKAYAEERIKIINAAYDSIRRYLVLKEKFSSVEHKPPDSPFFAKTASSTHLIFIATDLLKICSWVLKKIFLILKQIYFGDGDNESVLPKENQFTKSHRSSSKPFRQVLQDLKQRRPNSAASRYAHKRYKRKMIYHLRQAYGPRRNKGLRSISAIDAPENIQQVRSIRKISPIQ